MSWSSRFRFLNTVKFKVALAFALLFTLSALIAYAGTLYFMRTSMLGWSDALSLGAAEELLNEYMTGNRYRRLGKLVRPGEMPERDRAQISLRMPGIELVAAYRNTLAGRPVYTAFGQLKGRLYELRAESDGSVYSRAMNPSGNLPLLQQNFLRRVAREGGDNSNFRLIDGQGKIILSAHAGENDKTFQNWRPPTAREFETVGYKNGYFRRLRVPIFDGRTLEINSGIQGFENRIELYSIIFWSVIGFVLLLAGIAGWLIARHFISGVERISAGTRRVYEGDFSHRVAPGKEGVEIAELVRHFNRMTANTERLLTELQMVTDNIAHDLRTPLTHIRGAVELALTHPETGDYAELCGMVAEECDHLIAMINTMLEITRTNARPDKLDKQPLRLDLLLTEAYELLQILAEEKNLDFQLSLPDEPVTISAEKLKIQRLVANLLENAIKFTGENGSVRLSLTLENDFAVIQVADSGCGISDSDRLHVFERFFRADASRSLPGNGLGLALVQAVAQAHGGSVECSSTLGVGTVFTVRLPRLVSEP